MVKFILMTLLFLVPLLYGCSVNDTTNNIEPPKENFEEKITNYESEIDKLNQEIINLQKSKEYYRNYSNYCYNLVQIKEKEIEKFYTERRFKYTWRGCRYDNELRLNFVLTGDSNLPFLGENHKITWCIPYGDDDIYVGDIILYTLADENVLNAHPVVNKKYVDGEWVYITQGYNNPMSDGFVLTFGNIRGKLWRIDG